MTAFDPRSCASRLRDEPLERAGRAWSETPESYFCGNWQDRHPLNVPGPFYGGATDTCCDGPSYAPASLLYDQGGQGFVWRQPRCETETHALMTGASSDPFSGYAWNGDEYWTPGLVRAWWAARDQRLALIEDLVLVVAGPRPHLGSPMADLMFRCLPVGGYSVRERHQMTSIVNAFLDYQRTMLPLDLRRYIYFLESDSYPSAGTELPSLEA